MSSIISTIREVIRDELRALRITELGVVEAVHPHADAGDSDGYGVDVRLKNSGLSLKRVPVATNHIGTAAIPNVGDLLVLCFHQGDVNQPIVLGRLYNDEQLPPLNRPDELIFRLPLAAEDEKTLKAALRNREGQASPREVVLEMPPKISLHITDGEVRAVAGKSEMVLAQPGSSGGTVTVHAGNTRIVMNQDGDVELEARGSLTLKAGGDFKLEAASVSIESKSTLKLEAAASATIKANGQATLQATGAATVQAATLQLKGITSFSP